MPTKKQEVLPPPEVYVEGLKIKARPTTKRILPEDIENVAELGKIINDAKNSQRGIVVRVAEAIQNLDQQP